MATMTELPSREQYARYVAAHLTAHTYEQIEAAFVEFRAAQDLVDDAAVYARRVIAPYDDGFIGWQRHAPVAIQELDALLLSTSAPSPIQHGKKDSPETWPVEVWRRTSGAWRAYAARITRATDRAQRESRAA